MAASAVEVDESGLVLGPLPLSRKQESEAMTLVSYTGGAQWASPPNVRLDLQAVGSVGRDAPLPTFPGPPPRSSSPPLPACRRSGRCGHPIVPHPLRQSAPLLLTLTGDCRSRRRRRGRSPRWARAEDGAAGRGTCACRGLATKGGLGATHRYAIITSDGLAFRYRRPSLMGVEHTRIAI